MTIQTVYLAGPMRGYNQFNFPAFDSASARLREIGYDVYNPAEIDRALGLDETAPDAEEKFEALGGIEAAMERDFGAILKCDGVVLLPGWERSTGARSEVYIARTTGRAVHLYDQERGLGDDPGIGLVAVKEVRVRNDKTGGEKGSKEARFDLLPWDILQQDATLYGRGAAKYEARNWEKGFDYSLSVAALGRHFAAWVEGENEDQETGLSHLLAVRFHAAALLRFLKEYPELDDRRKSA